ncbi:hypothetical protein GPJ56_004273 [Histomonas meleagridis]|uniref:uncharacterized protein n=1 Tax=Histomonas meleagridis TaxID=135588 RepID=UPI00355A828D|nr:hypothetical protein GPJ56_004273 [Histomonas meleagridis]KAH0800513.1 hypothetical protein GO595_006716 [Histomonas meleagridis]
MRLTKYNALKFISFVKHQKMFVVLALIALAFATEPTEQAQKAPEQEEVEEPVSTPLPKSTRRPQRRGGKPKPQEEEEPQDNGKCHGNKCSKYDL